MSLILAYDLGTGGNKASLYDEAGRCLAAEFVPYPTQYPRSGWHEQRPLDWWNAIVQSTRNLFAGGLPRHEVSCIGISGHSLGVVPLDARGELLLDGTPIWSDSRPDTQPQDFFRHVSPADWYRATGSGFPAPLYSIFKIMWYRDRQADMFGRVHKIIGTKDYINYRLTGRLATDFSYASGSGVYDLAAWAYSPRLIAASGIDPALLPQIVPSTEVLGTLTPQAAEALGLPASVRVVAGGVDNSCMALGAKAYAEGRMYNSLGSSSWIAVCSKKPLLDDRSKPYVFAHVVKGYFASATAIFSAGTTFRWVRDHFCRDLSARAAAEGTDVYDLMTAEAAQSPVGAKGLLFNPSLAGGSSLDDSPLVRGAMAGLDLGHDRHDILRACIEGIALGLRSAMDELGKLTRLDETMIVVGGGSKSPLWRQILADVYARPVVKTNVDQQAAALGAAAVAAVGTGLWKDFTPIDAIHQEQASAQPTAEGVAAYARLLPHFRAHARDLARLAHEMQPRV